MSNKGKPVFSLDELSATLNENKSPRNLDFRQLAGGATLAENVDANKEPAPAASPKVEKPAVVHCQKLIRKIPEQFLERIKTLKEAGVYRLPANDFFLDAVLEKLEREERKLAAKNE
ncbi:hypothetical protein [Aeromonas caviae]|uniref:hypothetical protein n=1 Tax=Aeromonas caviae TaxID=648 RepID=UPI00385A5B64